MRTNASVVLLILIVTAMIEIGYWMGTEVGSVGAVIYWVGEYASVSLEAIFSIAWGVILVKLLHRVKHNPNLLPNRNMFIQHWCYLLAFVILYLFTVVAYQLAGQAPVSKQVLAFAVANLLNDAADLFEAISFFLVVYLMLPITDAAKQKRDRFQQFLFNGFLNREELKKAIFE